jgi:hypothetical protein
MKKSDGCLKVYLAIFLLIVLVAAFPYKEGFSNWSFFDVASWVSSKKDEERSIERSNERINETKDVIKDNYDDKYGTGSSGRSYVTTTTTNDSSNNIVTDEHKWLDTSNWGTYTN